jgi:hypothetical protein
MAGRVPAEHPARVILLIAFLLATVDDWIHPNTVTTEQGHTGGEVLWELGVFDVTALMRVQLIDGINRVTHRAEIGPAVDAVARAWWAYQRTTGHRATTGGETRHQQATGALIEARAHYTRLRARPDSTPRAVPPLPDPMPVFRSADADPAMVHRCLTGQAVTRGVTRR